MEWFGVDAEAMFGASRAYDARTLDRLQAGAERQQHAQRQDEREHAHTAERLGAAQLPAPVRLAMRAASRVMTGVAYYV